MLERLLSYKGFAIPRKVQRSTVQVGGEKGAGGYVVIASSIVDLIIPLASTGSRNGG